MKLGKHDKKIKLAASIAAGPVVAAAYQIHLNKAQAIEKAGYSQKSLAQRKRQKMQALLKPADVVKTVNNSMRKKLGTNKP